MLEDQSALDEIVDYVSQYEFRRTAFKVILLIKLHYLPSTLHGCVSLKLYVNLFILCSFPHSTYRKYKHSTLLRDG